MSESDAKPPAPDAAAADMRPKRARQRKVRAKNDAATTQQEAGAPLPHELLLAVARGERVGEHEPTFAERLAAAKASARYFAPAEKSKRRGKRGEEESGVGGEISRAKRTLAGKLARLAAAKDGGKSK